MYIVFRVKDLFFFQIAMELEFSGQIFEKFSNIKFCENLCSGDRVASSGRTNGQT